MPRLVVVGTGIRLGQITMEVQQAVTAADIVLAIMADSVSYAMLRSFNKNIEDLTNCYVVGEERIRAYDRMTERVIRSLHEGKNTCFALYGHPCVFAYPSRESVRRARLEGFEAAVLPGISADGCIFAELLLDPAEFGCQSYESKQFVASEPTWNANATLILWQPAVAGDSRHHDQPSSCDLAPIQRLLLKRYPADHRVILYESAIHPVFKSSILETTVQELSGAEVRPMATMVVPPLTSLSGPANRR